MQFMHVFRINFGNNIILKYSFNIFPQSPLPIYFLILKVRMVIALPRYFFYSWFSKVRLYCIHKHTLLFQNPKSTASVQKLVHYFSRNTLLISREDTSMTTYCSQCFQTTRCFQSVPNHINS